MLGVKDIDLTALPLYSSLINLDDLVSLPSRCMVFPSPTEIRQSTFGKSSPVRESVLPSVVKRIFILSPSSDPNLSILLDIDPWVTRFLLFPDVWNLIISTTPFSNSRSILSENLSKK